MRLFGSLWVTRNGERAGLPASRKVRALLAYIIMAPRPVHRAKLCETFWDPQRSSRRAALVPLQNSRAAQRSFGRAREGRKRLGVHRYVDHRGRRAWVVARAEAATSGDDLDLLKQLAAKFEGEFLEGFEADRIPLFEAWLIGERQRFQGLHADVLSRIIALLPRTGEALPYIRKRLDLLPCDVAAHRDLLATLAACGRIAEGEAHLEAATHLFRSQGLSSPPLDKAWREYRQLAARELRPESPRLPVAPPTAVAIEIGPAVHTAEAKPSSAAPFDHRPALRQHQRRSRTRVFRRRRHRKPDDGPLANHWLLRHRAQYGLHLQRQASRCEDDRARAERPIRLGGQRSAKRRKNARQRTTDRRGKQLTSLVRALRQTARRSLRHAGRNRHRLAQQLDAELVAAEARRAERSPNPDAMDLYFQGLAWCNKGQALEHRSQARSFFERALRLDPRNIGALVGLARVDGETLATYIADDRWKRLADAETALTEALSMAPDHAGAHVAMGLVQILTNRAAQGIAECERALALDPNLAEAHAVIGFAKIVIGRFEETETHIREAMRLSPRDRNLYSWLATAGVAKLYLGSEDEAVNCFRRSIEVNRTHPGAQYFLAGALALLGRLEEAQWAVRAAIARHPDFTISRFRGGAASDNPRYLAARERLCHGMRKAGVPER